MGDVIEVLTTATNTVEVEAAGPQGIPGVGVPTGGSALQVLRKKTGTDYDTEWAAAGSGSGSVTSVALASSDFTITGSPITDSGTITVGVAANALTLNKLETIQTAHFLGRHGGGAGDVQPVSASQARTILNVADGAEVNVNADWNAASGDAQILNKPTLGGAAALNVGTGAGTVAAGDDARLSDSRTPTAHAANHAAGGSDPLAPSDIGAQSLFTPVSQVISADVTLTSGRAVRLTLENYNGTTYNVTLPTTSNQTGDVFIVRTGTLVGPQTIRKQNFSDNFTTLATLSSGQSYRFITTGTTSGSWQIDPVFTHTHAATDITSGTLEIARIPTGTGSTQVALGDHTHTQLHDRSHAITSTSDHTAGTHKVFYSDGSGNVQELALGATGTVLTSGGTATAPSFAAASGGDTVSIEPSASDILSVTSGAISADDAGADRIVFWDDSASALKYLEAGSGLTISGTVMTASGGATINQAIAVGFVLN